MKVVGLTGGIGSGKTSILQLFKNLGIPVYIADIEAKKLMHTDEKLIHAIVAVFGKEAYTDKVLNRAYLAKQVFRDSNKLAQLNAMVHPAVQQDFLRFKDSQTSPFIIFENAILFENGSDALCDYIITVTAPIETRIERVTKRDTVTPQQVKDRMQHQWNDQLKIDKSDFVIQNINWDDTKKAVEKLYKKLLKFSKTEKS